MLAAGLVTAGILGGSTKPDTSARVAIEPDASAVPAPAVRAAVNIEPEQALVVTLPAHSGDEITTRQLIVTGFVVGEPVPIRISLQGRREREIDAVTIIPTRSPEVTRPQRAGRFRVAFDLPKPRPNGTMVVEIVLLTPDGRAFDMIRRRVRIGAIAPLAGEPESRGARLP